MHGVYLRDDLARDPAKALAWVRSAGLDTAIVNVAHARTLTALAQATIDTYTFALPDACMPDTWRRTLIRLCEVARVTKARGICIDPEMGWAKAPRTERAALRDALGAVAQSMHVIVTTHDGLRSFAADLSQKLGPLGCIGSPQVYDHQMGAPLDRPAKVVAKWAAQNWAAVVPSAGSFGADVASFQAYFAALPKAFGGIVWYAGAAPTGKRLAAIRAWAA